jgi:predicted GNAT family acetyltransferase
MRLRVYELREVNPPTRIPDGQMRRATIADTSLVTDWYHEFTKEALEEGSREEARKVASRFIALGSVYLWEDGEPVSMAFRTRPTRHGCTVTGVYTPPDRRGRGYASACVAGLSQILLDSGYQVCNLFTDLANPTSNSIYQRIGYRPVCDFIDHAFEE